MVSETPEEKKYREKLGRMNEQRIHLSQEAQLRKQNHDYAFFLPLSMVAIALITASTFLVVIGGL